MKQILHFLDEGDFQNFTAQLFSEELPSFQAIEGAGGDGGLDGIEGKTAYQMFFPEQKNRTKKKYVAKIDKDLAKLKTTVEEHELTVIRWVFVVPEDLHYEVVLHLQKQSKKYGIECLYWGASKLTALVNKHPHIKNAFPGIFLTDLKIDMERVTDGLEALSQRTASITADILKEDDYLAQVQQIKNRWNDETHSIDTRFGSSSVSQTAAPALQKKYQPMLDDLKRRKQAGDKMYELELKEINIHFNELVEKKNSEHVGRGTFHSSFRGQDIEKIEEKRTIELEKLSIKYGKPLEQTQSLGTEQQAQQLPELQLEPLQLLAMRLFAVMSDRKEISVIRASGGVLLMPLGQVSDSVLSKEFSDASQQEVQANLDELAGLGLLMTRISPKGNPIYGLTSAGYRVIKDSSQLSDSRSPQ